MAVPHQREELERLTLILAEIDRRKSMRHFFEIFPDEDALNPDGTVAIHRRALYPKHCEFMASGARYRERGFMAGNRLGKTKCGAYETTAHLTGLYPHWWEGKRFKAPVRWWAAGKTNETTRDIVQAQLLGEITGGGATKALSGTGMVPGNLLGKISWKQGVADLVDTIKVKHVSGGWSTLGFKSYQQGRGSFEGTAQHGIWLDEEPPIDVYGECLVRTATTGGVVFITFTPLDGLSETAMQFMPKEMRPAG